MNNVDLVFQTALMTLKRSNGEIVAEHLPCQLDTVNVPWNIEAQATIPTDWFDLYSLGWNSPVPARSDYFIDERTHEKYSVFGKPASYFDHLEVRVSQYSGDTP